MIEPFKVSFQELKAGFGMPFLDPTAVEKKINEIIEEVNAQRVEINQLKKTAKV